MTSSRAEHRLLVTETVTIPPKEATGRNSSASDTNPITGMIQRSQQVGVAVTFETPAWEEEFLSGLVAVVTTNFREFPQFFQSNVNIIDHFTSAPFRIFPVHESSYFSTL
jgi:hypothetical protein